MREVFERARQVAPEPDPVLILGERGTAKTWLARALHQGSGRSGAWVQVDCERAPAEHFDQQLFGQCDGGRQLAPTPAAVARAVGGTLLLHRIDELRWDLQSKLLRFLDRGEQGRFGRRQFGSLGVRVLATAGGNLLSRVKEGSFRADLYFRLTTFTLRAPPLRERMEDLPLLVDQCTSTWATGKRSPTVAAWVALESYSWPGNLPELAGVLWEAAQRSSGKEIDLEDLPAPVRAEVPRSSEVTSPVFFKDAKDQLLARFERGYLAEILSRCAGNLSQAARECGLHRRSVARLAKKYQLRAKKMR
jgi:DNA-binding NtrC family response regulator